MLAASLLFLATFDPLASILASTASAHEAMNAARVEATTRESGQPNRPIRVTLDYQRPDRAHLTYADAPPRQVWVEPNRVVVYDPRLQQYAVSKRAKDEALEAALQSKAPGLDGFLLALVASKGLDSLPRQLAEAKSRFWTIDGDSFRVEISNGESSVLLEIDRRTRRLLRAKTTLDKETLDRRFSYRTAPAKLAFSAPKGARQVEEIDPLLLPPTFADPTARAVVDKLFARFDTRPELAFTMTTDEGPIEVWLARTRARQRDAIADWSVQDRRVRLLDRKTGSSYIGEATSGELLRAVSALGTRVDPLVRQMMRGSNPFRLLLGRGSTVRTIGASPSPEGKTTVLEAESPSLKLTLYVLENGLPASLISEPKAKSGETMLGTRRIFRGWRKPKPENLAAPLGRNPGDLSRIPGLARP